jgi:single-stranded DNA-specific DHH superfamily exonuclease
MLTEKQFSQIKEELDNCQNPLFFHDDDADGLCSFLLLYRYKREGNELIVKARPVLDEKFIRIAQDHNPDKIFVLDVPMIKQEFADGCSVPIIWIDHHEPTDIEKVKSFNPRKDGDDNISTSSLCYNVVKQDSWIAGLGTIADWQIPTFISELARDYPGIFDEKLTRPEDALFSEKVGKLVKIIAFNLKGNMKDIKKAIGYLITIKGPKEILDNETEAARYLNKRYDKVNRIYENLKIEALKGQNDGLYLVHLYPTDELSLTKELSNELLYLVPDKIVLLGREKNGEIKASLRSSKHNIRDALQRALVGLQGYGGGHEHACGLNIKKEDFDKFLENFKAELRGRFFC